MKGILIYTVHKAASMFLHRLTVDAAREYGICYYSINDEQYYTTIKQQSWQTFIENISEFSCFGPIRSGETTAIFPKSLSDYEIVLHLRDPRDVLTSLFFSHAYSHKRKEGKFNPSDEKRQEWRDAGIDAFVIDKLPAHKVKYQLLISKLLDREKAKLVKYEDMVTNYPEWLTGFLSAFADLEVPQKKMIGLLNVPNSPDQIYNRLVRKYQNEFKLPKSENIYAHKRQIQPGDHKDKLKLNTIEQLNQELGDILTRLFYTV